MTVPMIQRLVETLAQGREASKLQPALKARPSKANHALRYLRRTFGWSIRHGVCTHNPAKGAR